MKTLLTFLLFVASASAQVIAAGAYTFKGGLIAGTSAGFTYDSTAGQLQLTGVPTGANTQKIAVLRTNVVAAAIGSAATFVFDSSDTMSANTSQNGLYGTFTNSSSVGCTTQGNCGTNSEPHAIGVLGTGTDTVNGNVSLYGVEGRINALGAGANQKYVGVVGVCSWQGSTFSASWCRGHDGLITITTDGTTPLAQGNAATYYARPIIGGSATAKYSYYSETDPAYMPSMRIGTAAVPTQRLEVWDTANPAIQVYESVHGVGLQLTALATGGTFGTVTNFPFVLISNSTTALSFDTSQVAVFGGNAKFKSVVQGSLGSAATAGAGAMVFCPDCTILCAGSGTGRIAYSNGSAWVCQ